MAEKQNSISTRILKSAETLFFKFGYSKATADEIAREAGVSKRTLYKYFNGKQLILEELVNTRLNFISSQMNIILESEHDFPEKLKNLMAVVTETIKDISLDFLDDLRRSLPAVWQKIYDYRKELVEKYYTKILVEGKKTGHFKPDLNIGVAVLLMINSMDLIINPPASGTFSPEIEQHIPVLSQEMFDELMNMIYNGILVKTT